MRRYTGILDGLQNPAVIVLATERAESGSNCHHTQAE